MTNHRCRTSYLALPLLAAMLIASHASQAEAQGQYRGGAAVIQTETAYPTGDRATSVILLERFAPAEVRAGKAYSYEVKLTNLTRTEIQDLVLTEQIAPALTVIEIVPNPDRRTGNQAVWQLGRLAAGQSKSIRVSGSSNSIEALTCCAKVTFSTTVCAVTKVVQPELSLIKTAPAEVLVCDPIPLRFVVTNSGSGIARDVVVTDRLPSGWTTTDGRSEFAFSIGDLAAGQSREFSTTVQATQTGRFVNRASAVEAGGLAADATAETLVRQPVLAVTKTGPAFRYIGRAAKFQITVANQGDAPARDAVLIDAIPAGTRFIDASDRGEFASGRVRWNLGTIAPGTSKTVNVTLKPMQAGVLQNTAVAQAYCAEARASAPLEVRGIPAILFEVVDVHDPIELGSQETYEITVLNQGSAEGTNIAITCTLPAEEEYISAVGPTNATVAGKTITFAPLRSLAPKASVTYRIVVKGSRIGDVRFKVSLISDQMSSSVEETESTHIY